MHSALISCGSNRLSLSWQYEGDPVGDYLVNVEVESHGFAGQASAYVSAGEFRKFVKSLRDLELNLRGGATLQSFSPSEVEVSVHSLDELGHLGVQGNIQSYKALSNFGHIHELAFSFEITPSELALFVKPFRASFPETC